MDRRAAVACVLLAACSPELDVPDGSVITCGRDGACPSGMLCQTSANVCVNTDSVDADAPQLTDATALGPTTVRVDFSEEMLDASVSAAGVFVIDGLTVTLVQVAPDKRSVTLVTGTQLPEAPYTLTVDGAADLALNAVPSQARSIIFNGFGTADRRAPEPLSPVAEALVRPASVDLAWTPRAGATGFTVELATDAAFSEPLQREVGADASNVTLDAAELELGLHYYWRVRSSLSDWSQVATFEVFDDIIFVYCPEAADCAARGSGALNDPFTTIGAAISAAVRAGVGQVRVASRCSSSPSSCNTAYHELVTMADGVDLLGGYEATFTSPPDPPTRLTIIENTGLTVVVASSLGATGEVRLRGFQVRGVNTPASPDIAYGVVIENCSAFAIIDCFVKAAHASNASFGVGVTGSPAVTPKVPGVRIVDSTIASGGAGDRDQAISVGLNSTSSDVLVVNSTLVGAASTYSDTWQDNRTETIGARTVFGSLRLERSTVEAGDVLTDSFDVAACGVITARSTAIAARRNNVTAVGSIIESNRACVSTGIAAESVQLVLSGTTVAIGGTPYGVGGQVEAHAIDMTDDGVGSFFDFLTLVNSLVVLKGTLGSADDDRYAAILEAPAPVDLVAIDNTTFAGFECLYSPSVTCLATGGQLTTALAGRDPVGSARAAEVTSEPSDTALGFAVDSFRLTPATPAAVRLQGKDTRTPTCGPQQDQDCAHLQRDRDAQERTCQAANDCYSRGAFELD